MNQPCKRCGSTERTKPNKAKPNGVCKKCKKINAQSYYYRTKEKFPGVPTNLTASDKIEIFQCIVLIILSQPCVPGPSFRTE